MGKVLTLVPNEPEGEIIFAESFVSWEYTLSVTMRLAAHEQGVWLLTWEKQESAKGRESVVKESGRQFVDHGRTIHEVWLRQRYMDNGSTVAAALEHIDKDLARQWTTAWAGGPETES